MRTDAIIEYSHRLVAGLTVAFVIATALVGWRNFRSVRWVSRPPTVALVFMLGVSVLGALAVLRGLSPALAALDRGLALSALALMATAAVVSWARRRDATLPDRLSFRPSFARLASWSVVAVFAVLSSGVLVAGSDSTRRCLGWPVFGAGVQAAGGWPYMGRLALAVVGSLLILAVVREGSRYRQRHSAIPRVSATVGALFLAEATIAVLILIQGPSVALLLTSVAVTLALWTLLVVLTILAGLTGDTMLPATPRVVRQGSSDRMSR